MTADIVRLAGKDQSGELPVQAVSRFPCVLEKQLCRGEVHPQAWSPTCVPPVYNHRDRQISTVHSKEPSRFPVVVLFSVVFLLLCVYLQKLKFNEVIKIRLLVYDIKAVPPRKCVSGASRCRAASRWSVVGL